MPTFRWFAVILCPLMFALATSQAAGGEKKPEEQAKELIDKYQSLTDKAKIGPDGSKLMKQLKALTGLSRATQDTISRLEVRHNLMSIRIAIAEVQDKAKPDDAIWPLIIDFFPQQAVPSRVKWEYKVINQDAIIKLGKGDITAGLNVLGNDHWELVSIVAESYFFKRPRPILMQMPEKRENLPAPKQ